MSQFFLGFILAIASIFLILLVLVQRGRGGGLTGALGGPGGQSAFGAKAGDIFTYITIWTVAIWILLCMSALWWIGCQDQDSLEGLGGSKPAANQNASGVLSGLPITSDDAEGDAQDGAATDDAAAGASPAAAPEQTPAETSGTAGDEADNGADAATP